MAGKRKKSGRKSAWQRKFGAAAKKVHKACKRTGARGKQYQRCVAAGMRKALR